MLGWEYPETLVLASVLLLYSPLIQNSSNDDSNYDKYDYSSHKCTEPLDGQPASATIFVIPHQYPQPTQQQAPSLALERLQARHICHFQIDVDFRAAHSRWLVAKPMCLGWSHRTNLALAVGYGIFVVMLMINLW